jgi:hypothetical protein
MKPTRPVFCFFASLFLAAACGGGRSGTGISTDDLGSLADTTPLEQIQGNVSSVEATRQPSTQGNEGLVSQLLALLRKSFALETVARAGSGLENIEVLVDNTDCRGETDSDGFFSLQGHCSGLRTLRFERGEDQLVAHMDVELPEGGSLVLQDVQIDSANGRVTPGSEIIDFNAAIVGAQCDDNLLSVASWYDPDGVTYDVDLSTSSVKDGSGSPESCADLGKGDRVDVRGLLQGDRSIGNATVVTGS